MQLERLIQIAVGFAVLTPCSAQTTTLASVASMGDQANGKSYQQVAVSADGSAVAFFSIASNLVAGDINSSLDVFVHEPGTGQTKRVSVDSSGTGGNDHSSHPSVSGDGRFVAFTSMATNLVPGDANGTSDVFLHDRNTGKTTLVSRDSSGIKGNHASFLPSLSADGRYVAFNSTATNLVPGDTNIQQDVFVRDMQSGTTWRVSVDSSGVEGDDNSYDSRISADGSHITFYSYATNLVAGDTNGLHDVFVHELATGLTERVSLGISGAEPDQQSWTGSLSADGQLVTFTSAATNLVPNDTNGATDAFVKDRATGAVTRVTVDSQGVPANSTTKDAFISPDGRYVAFSSWATNLVPEDTNDAWDVFVHDLATGKTIRASVDSTGAQADSFSFAPCLSGDGRQVVFQSWSTNLVDDDTNEHWDIFVRDRTPSNIGTNYCGPANLNSTGQSAIISASGSQTASDNHLTLAASQLPPNVFGYFLNSDQQGFKPFPPGSHGNLCLGGSIGRHAKQIASSGAAGELVLSVDLTTLPRPGGTHSVIAGETWNFQCWFRDNQSGPTSNFTDGIELAFQ